MLMHLKNALFQELRFNSHNVIKDKYVLLFPSVLFENNIFQFTYPC